MNYGPAPIDEQFQITGLGLVVAVSFSTELPTGKALKATVHLPDGSKVACEAFKEWLLRRNAKPMEKEGFFLPGITNDQVPAGSLFEVDAI